LARAAAANRVLVEAMHQPRPLAVRVAQHPEHAVEMARGAGTALHRKPHRLVEHQHVGVFVERDRFKKRAGLLVSLAAGGARFRRIEPQRRNADRLPGLEPVLRLRALTVDAHLAFADDALDVGEAQARKPRLEETVHPHAGFVGGHRDVLHAGRRRRLPDPFCLVILRGTPQASLEGRFAEPS
jgi:hypothetical protein